MKLPRAVIEKLLDRGLYMTRGCDACGNPLGLVRWTIKDQPGEWCSRECRDGIEVAGRAETRIAAHQARKGGRPKLYRTDADRQRAYRRRRRYEIPVEPVDSAAT
jgi:hypothetical protein